MGDDELAELLLRAARSLRRGHRDAFEPLGLSPSQARALRVILKAASPPRMTDLAERLGIVPRSATTLVDALEAAGLVRRADDPASRRSVLVVPTTEGLAVRDRLREARRRAAEDLFAPLSTAQRETLRGLLDSITG
ncbi:MAG: MarR family transcriptional regulator [Streptosporangiaceae bacterium]